MRARRVIGEHYPWAVHSGETLQARQDFGENAGQFFAQLQSV
jgi:hypothetical protein